MNFAYKGFSQEGSRRRYSFGAASGQTVLGTLFSIEVEMPLLLKNRISIQDCPSFCLRLLEEARVQGPDKLHNFEHYVLEQRDLDPVLLDRSNAAAAKAAKKPPRRPAKKPTADQNVYGVGTPRLR